MVCVFVWVVKFFSESYFSNYATSTSLSQIKTEMGWRNPVKWRKTWTTLNANHNCQLSCVCFAPCGFHNHICCLIFHPRPRLRMILCQLAVFWELHRFGCFFSHGSPCTVGLPVLYSEVMHNSGDGTWRNLKIPAEEMVFRQVPDIGNCEPILQRETERPEMHRSFWSLKMRHVGFRRKISKIKLTTVLTDKAEIMVNPQSWSVTDFIPWRIQKSWSLNELSMNSTASSLRQMDRGSHYDGLYSNIRRLLVLFCSDFCWKKESAFCPQRHSWPLNRKPAPTNCRSPNWICSRLIKPNSLRYTSRRQQGVAAGSFVNWWPRKFCLGTDCSFSREADNWSRCFTW